MNCESVFVFLRLFLCAGLRKVSFYVQDPLTLAVLPTVARLCPNLREVGLRRMGDADERFTIPTSKFVLGFSNLPEPSRLVHVRI